MLSGEQLRECCFLVIKAFTSPPPPFPQNTMNPTPSTAPQDQVVHAFRARYYQLQHAVGAATTAEQGDSVVLSRLRDELDEFSVTLRQHRAALGEEGTTISTNISLLREEVWQAYQQVLDRSHHGTHHPVSYIRTGRSGRPRAVIDREWLTWAVQHHSTSAIATFLNLGRPEPQEYPFEPSSTCAQHISSPESHDMATSQLTMGGAKDWNEVGQEGSGIAGDMPSLEPIGRERQNLAQARSYTSRAISQLSDEDLDELIQGIRVHYPNAGLAMLHGSLHAVGHRVPREQVRAQDGVTEEATAMAQPDQPRGTNGAPDNLNEVTVEEPSCDLSATDVTSLYDFILPLLDSSDSHSLAQRWVQGLAFCRGQSSEF
ncbi:hypothetical protein M407DRAFT_5781 [Tulasnella calospora MUT 4182]|uniref:Uncharacterized protein n=1 Tax=Tulasnella calospora MUT 4182 TaxID=1051891 RepID=A0A0C3L8B3_9AGAM|nr:hypothetical protein M407DRAFT_5781 [Tulasnella calospora MUT 4182]